MGILDGVVEWISEQVMNLLDMITSSVLGALGCNMDLFIKYFPMVEVLYEVFVAIAIGLILLNLVWQLFRNFILGLGNDAEEPVKLTIRSVVSIFLVYYSDEIVNFALNIGGTPYSWIMDASLPNLNFANFNSTIVAIVGALAGGSVALIGLILVIVLAWNYLKLLLEAAERYILLGVMVFTAPIIFALWANKSTSSIFSSWCRMFAGQVFLLIMNAWCLRVFVSMIGAFIANPLAF